MSRFTLLSATVALGAFAAAACGPAAAPPAAPAPGSAQSAALTHPERLEALFDALDLERPGLEAVKAAAEAGDTASAASALIAYYRAAPTAAWVRDDPYLHDPGGYGPEVVDRLSGLAADDVFWFQGVEGQAPRLAAGGLDWDHRGPRDDFEWALFLNRHFLLLPLVRSEDDATRPDRAGVAAALMTDWVLAKPPEDLENERQMTAAWRPMSSASRLLQAWPHAFFGFLNEEAFTDEARLLMLASVPEQAAHLRKHHRRGHNHTIKEMAALAHAAAVWPEFKDADAWYAYAVDTLAGEINTQVYPDGVHWELSNHYHRTALDYLTQLKRFADASGRSLPADFARVIEAMGDYLAHAMRPTGFGLLNNNADLDMNRDRVADLADVFAREDWRYIATGGAQGEPPARTSRLFAHAGHALFRSGFAPEDSFLFFDIGPYGAAHQHRDKLNVVLTAFGRDLLTDAGRYRYEPDDPYVQYVRATREHNTLTVDGFEQNADVEIAEGPLADAAAFRGDLAFARGVFDAGYDGLEGGALHRRAVAKIGDAQWLVVDHIDTDRPRRITARWRFGGALAVEADGQDARSVGDGVGHLRITPIAPAAWALDIVAGREGARPMGWRSPSYNRREPAATAVYAASIDGPTTMAWILTAGETPVDAPSVDADTPAAGAGAIDVAVGAERYLVRLGAPATPMRTRDQLTFTGAFAHIASDARHTVFGGALTTSAGEILAEGGWPDEGG